MYSFFVWFTFCSESAVYWKSGLKHVCTYFFTFCLRILYILNRIDTLIKGSLYTNLNKKCLFFLNTTYFCFYRVIDFVNESVQTLAGNGTKGSDYKGGGKGTSQASYNRISFPIISGFCTCIMLLKSVFV